MKDSHNVDQLASILLRSFRGAQQAASLSGQMHTTYGTVIDVKDPEFLGRVRVIIDEVDPEYLIGKDFQQSGDPTETDWIFPVVPLIGRQPEEWVKRLVRVQLLPRNGDPNRLNFGDPVYDPDEHPWAIQPQNSGMTRLPVYPPGKLPDARKENLGCMVIEEGGPQGDDWLCVCMKRSGQYAWVRHADRLHIHESQVNDSAGDREGRVNDDVLVTTTRGTGASFVEVKYEEKPIREKPPEPEV